MERERHGGTVRRDDGVEHEPLRVGGREPRDIQPRDGDADGDRALGQRRRLLGKRARGKCQKDGTRGEGTDAGVNH